MDNITEIKENQNPPERIIKLGEDFQPFDPKHTVSQHTVFYPNPDNILYSSAILLAINETEKLPFKIRTTPTSLTSRAWGITPFDREVGGTIDNNDLKLKTRTNKFLNILNEENTRPADFSKAPLFISFDSCPVSTETNKKFYKRLRLVLMFPTSRYESRSDTKDKEAIFFSIFYPIDTSPLPTSNEDAFKKMHEGVGLFLPRDSEKLAQIRAKFVLAPEKPDPETSSG